MKKDRLDLDYDNLKTNNIDILIKELKKIETFNLFYEDAKCCEYKKSEEPKKIDVVIVGTITPYAGKGFFYTAPDTPMYKLLDACYETTSFNKNKEEENIEGIKEELKGKNIYFIDVFKKVIRKKESASDADILFGSLNYAGFEDLLKKINQETRIVANSNLAYDICIKILNVVSAKNNQQPPKIYYRQFFRCSDDERKKLWWDILREPKGKQLDGKKTKKSIQEK